MSEKYIDTEELKQENQGTDVVSPYIPSEEIKIIQDFVNGRIHQLKAYRKELKIEDEWREADNEYIPRELEFGNKGKRFETDQDTGYRSRLVPISDSTDAWRSNNSAPTLLTKIQTAISILVDNNPEAMLSALQRKYEATTDLANSLWKRNWEINNSKETLKLFIFNLVKYGWATGRSYPRLIKYSKETLTELDPNNPDNNKYESKDLIWFNDVARQNLDPYRTWIDEQTVPYDTYTTNDCYYELDFSYDAGEVEFGQYDNWKYVKKDSRVEPEITDNDTRNETDKAMERKDIVTIGFYENRLKDMLVIKAVKDDIILHTCPLPNDDGLLSLWHTMWILRSAKSPYGISLWKIIKQDKVMYDKWNNMSQDQLTLSIYKFGFYTGTNAAIGDGVIKIAPGESKQLTNGEMKWMEIPGPGKDSWDGKKELMANIDTESGVTPTMEGDITGKTLGEIQLAKEAGLKRMKIPLENIAWAIECDAYLSLSWMAQIYSTPEVKEFATLKEMQAYENEMQTQHAELFPNRQGQNMLQQVFQAPKSWTATYYPEISLHLEDRDGQLYESNKSRYFQVGTDIKPEHLKWRGIFKVIPKSLLGTSEIILKQTKTEMANMLIPLLSMPPELVMKTAKQLIKINEEDAQDWLPDSWLNQQAQNPAEGQISQDQPLFVPQGGQQGNQPLFVPQGGNSMQAQMGATPQQAQTAVPRGQVSSPTPKQMGRLGAFFKKL